MDLAELWRTIRQLARDGVSVGDLRTSFLHRFAGPMATLIMPLMAAVAGFGFQRGGGTLLRVIIGMALGFSYFIAENFMLVMGDMGVAPALLASFAPFAFFLVVGYYVLFAVEPS